MTAAAAQPPPAPPPLLVFDPVPAEIHGQIAAATAACNRYIAARSDRRILPNVLESIRVEMTYNSNAIEGNTLTLRETQLVIEGQSLPGGKSLREVYEARNHDRALRMVEDLGREVGALTERHLLDIHAAVMAEIDPKHAGRFRTERVLIAGSRHIPPGSHRFAELIPAMLELANRSGVHPLLQAAELHYNFVAIHPFSDGNGRTARLLMNLVLLRADWPMTVIEVSRRGEYLAALDQANSGNWSTFAGLIAECVAASANRIVG